MKWLAGLVLLVAVICGCFMPFSKADTAAQQTVASAQR